MYLFVCNYKNCCNKQIFFKYCKKHYKIFYNKYALIIQKNYLRYKTNKKLKYIYKKLPYDLQCKIDFFINQEHNYKKYKQLIAKIINKKIIKYFFYYNFQAIFTIEDLSYHYYLINKYSRIINFNILKYFYILQFDILKLLFFIVDQDIINTLNYLDNFNNQMSFINYINFKNINNNNIIDCIMKINKFKNTYENPHYSSIKLEIKS